MPLDDTVPTTLRPITRRSTPVLCCQMVSPSTVSTNLRAQLASHPAIFAQSFTEKLMMYAINRDLDYFDMPQIRAVVRGAAKDNYTLSSLVLGIVHSDAFRKQGPAPAAKAVAANNK